MVDYTKTKTKWIECSCSDSDHAIRLTYYKDTKYDLDEFSIEYKLCKKRYGLKNKIKFYFKNLFNALLSRENVYMSFWAGGKKEAKQIEKFIKENT